MSVHQHRNGRTWSCETYTWQISVSTFSQVSNFRIRVCTGKLTRVCKPRELGRCSVVVKLTFHTDVEDDKESYFFWGYRKDPFYRTCFLDSVFYCPVLRLRSWLKRSDVTTPFLGTGRNSYISALEIAPLRRPWVLACEMVVVCSFWGFVRKQS